jgi:hypothetical protein
VEAMFQKQKLDDEDDLENELSIEDDDEFYSNKQEEMLVDEFLSKFVIVSESSTLDHINIVIMLKAIPNQIVDYNLEQT